MAALYLDEQVHVFYNVMKLSKVYCVRKSIEIIFEKSNKMPSLHTIQ